MNVRVVFALSLSALLLSSVAPVCALDSASVGLEPVTFSDGTIATSFDHCGDTDLCARLAYKNGDQLAIYSEGAAFCQPYMLHFVKTNAGVTVYEYTRTINHDAVTTSAFGTSCGHSRSTQMVMDHGLVHMTVSENSDGTLRIVFTP